MSGSRSALQRSAAAHWCVELAARGFTGSAHQASIRSASAQIFQALAVPHPRFDLLRGERVMSSARKLSKDYHDRIIIVPQALVGSGALLRPESAGAIKWARTSPENSGWALK